MSAFFCHGRFILCVHIQYQKGLHSMTSAKLQIYASEAARSHTLQHGIEHTVVKTYTYINLAQVLFILESLGSLLNNHISLHHADHSIFSITTK